MEPLEPTRNEIPTACNSQEDSDCRCSFPDDLAYWKERLRGAPEFLELPTDRPRPLSQTYLGAREDLVLSGEVAASLEVFNRAENVTPFMSLLAVFQVLLARYSGQRDILVGVPIANRQRVEVENLIGFFVNTLVLRTDLSGEPGFREVVARVRRAALEAYQHQDLPFEKLVEELNPPRDPSRHPVFQTMFALRNAPVGLRELAGLEVSPQRLPAHSTRFDLELHLWANADALGGSFYYNTELFDGATIERMAGHFQTLLEAVLEEPERPVWTAAMLTAEEKRRILVEWNDTAADYPRDKCVHELFEEQARRTPEAVAVVFGREHLSYRELNERANGLALHLRGLGVGPEVLVGICVERSPEMVVGLLGILKAGGAYVPLDPAYPKERLAFVVEDTAMRVLVTQTRLISLLPAHKAAVVALEPDFPAPEHGVPSGGCRADHLAYVIYTSGSTGRPKGVCVPHRGVVGLVKGTCYAGFGPDEIFLQLAPVAFDASTFEIWGPLLNGARLVVFPPGAPSLGELGEFIHESRISTLWLTAGLFNQMVEDQTDRLKNVRQFLAGGDVLSVSHVKKALEKLPDCQLINGYGPTEGTTFTCCHRVLIGDLEGSSIPIGRPIANRRVFLLDDSLQPVPVGVPGELHIAGDGLAVGYLNRPELTAERFIADPFSQEPGARLYRTGDLCRYLPDGNIEFLGRKDHQVKIRGFRVELGEIEATLELHAGVRQAVVVTLEDGAGDKRLAAYLVAVDTASPPGVAELRDFLKGRMAPYMVPGFFVMLKQLPLTPNGKVDRKALPAPEPAREQGGFGYAAPRTPTEEALAGIWAEVLGTERVGIHDNFFEMGGHSLVATRVVARVRRLLEVEVPLRALFEFPTIAGLAEAFPVLRGAGVTVIPPLLPASRDQSLALSFAQQRLWFLNRFEETSTGYHISEALRLRGVLDREALERALNGIVARHESLRTHFVEGAAGPVQIVDMEMRLTMLVEDLSALEAGRQEQAVAAASRLEGAAPFDLTRGPLLRAKLIILGEREHIFLWTCHHIVSDGWSLGIFSLELAALYLGFRGGKPANLPELAVQYADYAVWQRGWLQGDELKRQLGYWRKQLSDAPTLELPTDRPRPLRQTSAGAQQDIALSGKLAARLKAFNRAENVTPFMSLLAVFQVLLARYGGQRDILVGVPIANRQRVELENLIGFFVNTLVLRTDLSGESGFREVVARVRRAALDAYQHQDLPFEKLVEELNPARDASRHPIFQAMFALQNAPEVSLELAGLEVSPQRLQANSTRFDLELHLWAVGDGWAGSFYYNTDLFDGATIERMSGHFQTLLEAVLEEPERPVWAANMLPAEEKRRILVEWNDTAADYPRDKCVHELFEEQVERTPAATAVVFEGEHLTYRELNERANVLARHLRGLGVGPEVLVGICFERSLEMVVGLLGILKAGGACVPVDPAYPEERLAFILEDTGPGPVVTQERLASRLPKLQRPMVFLEADQERFGHEARHNLGPLAAAPNVAYVLYTSGSTGKPKGVAMCHRPFCNLVCWQSRVSSLPPTVKTLQFAPLNFDVSFQEIFSTICFGGVIYIASEALRQDTVELLHYITEAEIQRLFLPFVALQQLAEVAEATGSVPLGLREVITAGEQLLISPCIAKLFERLKDCRLYNHYGPTETHVVTSHLVSGPSSQWPALPPIGRPISNTQVYLLDQLLQPVPQGVPAELYIGGEALARGYHHQPDLTAARFIADPFGKNPGGRLFKTGDLARHLPGGNIEFLGRNDDQVKVRGHRVELGEIETVLMGHPSVGQASVAAWVEPGGDKRLVVYVVPARQAETDGLALRNYLRSKLPDFMMPAHFVMLEQLPLTPSGKVNRRALPKPEPAFFRSGKSYATPRTPTEEALAEIWAEVLGIGSVGIHDNFFELGGHSLLATRVVARIRQVLEVVVPLRTLFEFPTIARLAEAFPALRGAGAFLTPPLLPTSRNQPLPPSFAQQRLWFLDRFEESSTGYHLSESLRLRGYLDREALARALNEIVARHESLRTHFLEDEAGPVQVVDSELRLTMLVEDLSSLEAGLRGQAVAAAARLESAAPFDLSQGPLLRVKLLVLGEREHVLLWTCHHIVSDGWSQGIFFSELTAFYAGFREGKKASLPELPVQYADYALWQRGWLQGGELERQLEYWRKQLGDAPVLELPTDRPRPLRQTYHGARQDLALSGEVAAKLKTFNRAENVTPFMSLLAVFQVLLARYSGQRDILVGVPIANRQQVELENLIGFFVNTLVLRTDLSGEPGFREVVARVRRAALDAYQHQDLPFEKLVEELNPARDPSRHPIFQAMFALQNAPEVSRELAGLEVRPQWLQANSTRFDLELHLWGEGVGWGGSFYYNTDLFEQATIGRMAGHFQTLLEAVLEEPERPVSAAAMLTAGERRQILVEWNDTAADYPKDKCVHELFEEQVERTPEAVAVVFERAQLSYRELNKRANGLAHHLRGLGVEPGALVGICVERSLEMVVGLLGILKAGGAYVPLDSVLPTVRLQVMIEDAKAEVLLTDQKLTVALPSRQTKVVYLDGLALDVCEDAEGLSIKRRPVPEDVAYVLYTSGSTGKPKGVQIPHRAIVNFLASMQKEPGILPGDILLALTTLSFDIAGLELYLPLVVGARVVVARREDSSNGESLARLMRESGTTVMQATPATWRMLIQGGWRGDPRLKILCGGESLPPDLAGELISRNREVWNLYGPTETTIWSAITQLREREPVVIGRPIRNTRFYLLDDGMQPVPVGVPGELHIAGDGLAIGYLNRPELTAERFITDPFGDQPGARLYKTGDLCRYLPDGNIEFLGRKDHQVKIRGFRVELGEIEATIESHAGVRQAVVVALEHGAGDKRLAAYVVAVDPSGPPGVAELRDFLGAKLPHYMMPGAFVMLEQLPLTPNGKVDRKALPAPELSRDAGGRGYVAPRTSTEEALAEIWQEVLGLERVGVHDNFFELGGHSLLVVRLQSRVQKELGRKPPLIAFFQAPTIAEFAKAFGLPGTSIQSLHLLTPPSSGNKSPLFWIDSIVAGQRLAATLGTDRPVYAVESSFEEEWLRWDELQPVGVSIEELAARCVSSIRRLQPSGPYNLAGLCFSGLLAFETARQIMLQNEEVALLALLDTYYYPGRRPVPRLWLRKWAYHARQTSLHGLGYLWRNLRDKWSDWYGLFLPNQGAQYGAVAAPPATVIDEMDLLELRGSFRGYLVKAYKGRPYTGRTVLFRSTANPVSWVEYYDSRMGWKEILSGEISLERFNCLHSDLAKEPHLIEVARRLRHYFSQNDRNPDYDRNDLGQSRSSPELDPKVLVGTP